MHRPLRTYPAFPNSSTRGRALTNFLAWLKADKARAIKVQGSTTIQRSSLCALKNSYVVIAVFIHRLLEWTHSRTTRTL